MTGEENKPLQPGNETTCMLHFGHLEWGYLGMLLIHQPVDSDQPNEPVDRLELHLYWVKWSAEDNVHVRGV